MPLKPSAEVEKLISEKRILHTALSKLEAELRKAGTLPMEFYQRERDHQIQAEFLKMADHAKEALDSVILEPF